MLSPNLAAPNRDAFVLASGCRVPCDSISIGATPTSPSLTSARTITIPSPPNHVADGAARPSRPLGLGWAGRPRDRTPFLRTVGLSSTPGSHERSAEPSGIAILGLEDDSKPSRTRGNFPLERHRGTPPFATLRGERMNWKAMTDKAKQTFQQRGGSKAAKEDAEEVRNIAQGQGSITDKAKEAAAAIREPGAHHPDSPDAQSQGGSEAQQPN